MFLNPLQPAGTLAFNYLKPFASLQIDIYKGLSYSTTWNYYAYDSRAPVNPSVTVPAGSGPTRVSLRASTDRGTGLQWQHFDVCDAICLLKRL